MRAAPPELAPLLATGKFARADLYEFLLANGAALRYTSAPVDITADGETYYSTVPIEHGDISEVVGVEVDNLTVKIYPDESAQIGGIAFQNYLFRGGLYGAWLNLRRGFMADWGAEVYTILRFAGYVSQPQICRSYTELEIKSPLHLLNIKIPRLLYQASCQRMLYDQGCGLDQESYQVSGVVLPASTASTILTNLPQEAGYFDLGFMDFTSGALSGTRRTIKAHLEAGTLKVIPPLWSAPAGGDAFVIYPGCDRKMSTCQNKFNNLARFDGQPFIPVPETAVMTKPATTSTSGGGGKFG